MDDDITELVEPEMELEFVNRIDNNRIKESKDIINRRCCLTKKIYINCIKYYYSNIFLFKEENRIWYVENDKLSDLIHNINYYLKNIEGKNTIEIYEIVNLFILIRNIKRLRINNIHVREFTATLLNCLKKYSCIINKKLYSYEKNNNITEAQIELFCVGKTNTRNYIILCREPKVMYTFYESIVKAVYSINDKKDVKIVISAKKEGCYKGINIKSISPIEDQNLIFLD